jgi:CDP-4-dehydro-6-deoxyglucose reductase
MVTPTVFELAFEPGEPVNPAHHGEKFHFQAGQFISIVIPGAGPKGRDLRRAYSIASCPEVRPVELCVKLVEEGPGTNYLYHLKPGETFKGYAPYGDFVYEPKHDRHICFVSTGTGVAPFRSMLESKHYNENKAKTVLCLLGVRTEDELLYHEHFVNHREVKWVPAVSKPTDKWKGFKGRVTDYLRSLDNHFPWTDCEFYLCGNGEMIKEVKALLAERKVEPAAIHMEKYY